MRDICLGERLRTAAKFVRQDAVFADIGTDHAYLPLFLLQQKRIKRAIASDVNEGPLAKARANAREHGFCDSMDFLLTDGALALCNMGVTDIAICGMGGELIARIISDATYLKNEKIRLILEPMSRQSHLRRYLAKEGFSFVAEEYVTDNSKHYVCIVAEYSGEKRDISDVAAEIGECESRDNDSPAKLGYFRSKLHAAQRSREGKVAGGESIELDDLLIGEYAKIIETIEKASEE